MKASRFSEEQIIGVGANSLKDRTGRGTDFPAPMSRARPERPLGKARCNDGHEPVSGRLRSLA